MNSMTDFLFLVMAVYIDLDSVQEGAVETRDDELCS
jgi:hypothetical protein